MPYHASCFFPYMGNFFYYLHHAIPHAQVIWGLCNRKRGNCQKKPNLLLYAKYVFYAEIRSDLTLTHFLFFLVIPFLLQRSHMIHLLVTPLPCHTQVEMVSPLWSHILSYDTLLV